MSLVSSWVKLVVGECLVCCVKSYSYLVEDMSVGEAAAPDGRCIPMPLVLCLFQLVLGGTNVV